MVDIARNIKQLHFNYKNEFLQVIEQMTTVGNMILLWYQNFLAYQKTRTNHPHDDKWSSGNKRKISLHVPEIWKEIDKALKKLILLTGATATVSTFDTVVGHPNTPTSAGNGGFRRGFPCLPSSDSIKAYQTT